MTNKIAVQSSSIPPPAPAPIDQASVRAIEPTYTPPLEAPERPADVGVGLPSVTPLDQIDRVFVRSQGKETNYYVLSPSAQAQVVIDNNPTDRAIIVAQPAGNVGAGLWWRSDSIENLRVAGTPEPTTDGAWHGVRFKVSADAAGELVFERPMLDSVRAIRDIVEVAPHETERLRAREQGLLPVIDARDQLRRQGVDRGFVAPAAVSAEVVTELSHLDGPPYRVVMERSSISGGHHHRIVFEARGDTVLAVDNGRIIATSAGRPQLEITHLTDIPPLTPRAPLDLLAPAVRERLVRMQAQGSRDPALPAVLKSIEDLSFLIFDEKAVAGGWRFLTYFGRDTLLSARMMASFLAPASIEAILRGALGALDDRGVVAHEPEEADQAEYENLTAALAGKKTPAREHWSDTLYDYKMVDDDFLLPSLASEYLGSLSAEARRTFLEATNARGETNLRSLGRNLARVVRQALPYARSVTEGRPDPTELIRLLPGEKTGDWRDSYDGLGGGVYPASINLELVPTALAKAAALVKTLGADGELLGDWAPELEEALQQAGSLKGGSAADQLRGLGELWETARSHFAVELTPDDVVTRLRHRLQAAEPMERTYLRNCEIAKGVDIGDVVAKGELPKDFAQGVKFSALSLDAEGRPIEVMHTDGIFGLIGSELREDAVREMVRLVSTPYPLGLASDTGLLIANAALSGDTKQYEIMGTDVYHGELHWTWPPAHVLAGFTSQRAAAQRAGKTELVRLIDGGIARVRELVRRCDKPELLSAELYASRLVDGKEGVTREPIPYAPPGQKANSTQLWTTALPFWMWQQSPADVQDAGSSVAPADRSGSSALDVRAGGVAAARLDRPFAGLEPKAVWQHFSDITRIPRKSGNEGAIREHIKAFAVARGIQCDIDATGNVLLRVNPDAKGPVIGMQAHLDMVCVKDDDVRFDFGKDAIPVARDGDKLYAEGTTLGADNGIGIAYALAMAEKAKGPLELLFTVDEEEGFTGVDGLTEGWLKAEKMINLDSEEEGFFTIACAGGRDFVIQLDTERQPVPRDFVALEISIDGLKGGHSGDEIGKDRVNAVRVLGEILAAARAVGVIYGVKGGVARNAIPSSGSCTIGLPPDAVDAFKHKLAALRDELATSEDPDLTITSNTASPAPADTALSHETVDRIVGAIEASPHGVIKATDRDPNQPYVSINLAMIEELDDGSIQISSMSRSPSETEIDAVGESVRAVAERFGGTLSEKNGFPGWEPDYDSTLLATAHAAYEKLFGKPAKTLEIHAGLECGALKQKYPDMEIISLGPDIHDPHTPQESVSIGSVERSFALLEAIVDRIHGGATAS